MTRLQVRKLKDAQQFAPGGLPTLHDGPITIGRSSKNAVVLPDNKVSRHHCVIELAEGQPRVRDLKSHIGTLVNGKPITTAQLSDGDVIAIGPYEIVFGEPATPRNAQPSQQALESNANRASAEELKQLRSEHAALQQKLAEIEQRERLQQQENAQQCDALRAQHEDIAGQLEERNAELVRLSETLAAAREQNQHVSQQLEQARAGEQMLQQQVRELERSRADALRQLSQADAEQAQLTDYVHTLRQAARQLEAFQVRLELIETAWVELEERIESAGDDEQIQEQAAVQRHAMSAQLGEVTEQRDQAVAALHELVHRLVNAHERLSHQNGRGDATVVTAHANAANSPPPEVRTAQRTDRKRWGLFGIKK